MHFVAPATGRMEAEEGPVAAAAIVPAGGVVVAVVDDAPALYRIELA